MSEQAEWQKWCEDTAPVMAAVGRGEVVQVFCAGKWIDKEAWTTFQNGLKYRIKPRTIRIGDYDVPEPMREAPEVESQYWVADPALESLCWAYTWRDDATDAFFMNRNVCHSTREAAELHAQALISLTAKKD